MLKDTTGKSIQPGDYVYLAWHDQGLRQSTFRRGRVAHIGQGTRGPTLRLKYFEDLHPAQGLQETTLTTAVNYRLRVIPSPALNYLFTPSELQAL